MAHALRRYARHVQKVLEVELPKRPPYLWCLQMVQRYWENVGGMPNQQKKIELAKLILPVGALHLQVEGRFRYLSSKDLPPP